MCLVELTAEDRTALDEALRTTKRVREWRQRPAVRLLVEGLTALEVAQVVGCSASSVYYRAEDWREAGLAGLAEGPHAGRPRRLDDAAEVTRAQVLAADPQAQSYAATDWTVPLVHTELARRGAATR